MKSIVAILYGPFKSVPHCRYPRLVVFALVILSLYCSACWCIVLGEGVSPWASGSFAGAILSLISFLMLARWIVFWKKTRPALAVFDSIVGVLFSVAVVIGWRIHSSGVVFDINIIGSTGITGITKLSTLLIVVGLSLIVIPAIGCINEILDKNDCFSIRSRGFSDIDNNRSRCLFGIQAGSLKFLLIASVVILLCWLPVFLAMFPGVNGYDFAYQIKWFQNGELNSHHPILHTLLLGFCLDLGIQLGAAWFGLVLYCVFQMGVMAAIFSYATDTVYLISKSKGWMLFSLAWFSLCPLNSILAISATKDTLFCGFFIWAISCFLRNLLLGNRGIRCAALCFATILTLLFRNNAIIAYIGLVLCVFFWSLFCHKPQKKNIVITLITPFTLFLLITGPAYSWLGVHNGDAMAESLSVPIQQLARTANVANDLSDDDMNVINQLIPEWSNYQSGISDAVKNTFNQNYFDANTGEVIKRYIQIGLSHPVDYIESLLLGTCGYWIPGFPALPTGGLTFHPYLETPSIMIGLDPTEYLVIDHDSLLSGIGEIYEGLIVGRVWNYVPIISVLMSTGSLVWFYIELIRRMVAKPCLRVMAVPVLVLLLYWGTCLLGPCALARYVYPLFAFLPFVLAAIMSGGFSRGYKQTQ